MRINKMLTVWTIWIESLNAKTLSFFMPVLFDESSIQIVITPLNILGAQNVEYLRKAGIPAISISAETATVENFVVRLDGLSPSHVLKSILAGYQKAYAWVCALPDKIL